MESSDLPVFQLLDSLGWLEDSITEGDVEVGHSPIILDVPVRGLFEYIFVVFDAVVKSADLFFEVADFGGLLGVASGNGREEPLCDGLEDVGVKVRVGCQDGCNGIRRHRWFRTLDQTNWERDTVFGGRGIGGIDRSI